MPAASRRVSLTLCLIRPLLRGDFAAGKMLADGVPERGEILPEDIQQCVVDIDTKIQTLPEGPPLTGPADPAALTAVRALESHALLFIA